MPVDIDRLSEDDLRDLNHRIVQRLRVIQQLRAHSAMMSFSIGDRVAFNADGREIRGTLTRYNSKTVTLIADGGARWNISPSLLRHIEVAAEGPDIVIPQPKQLSRSNSR
jgi:hypothetical protein